MFTDYRHLNLRIDSHLWRNEPRRSGFETLHGAEQGPSAGFAWEDQHIRFLLAQASALQ